MKKYAILIISFCAILFSNNINAQVFSIGNQSSKDAVLDLSEDSQTGLILPRMTTAQRDAIKSPADGLLIYNTSLKAVEVFTNPNWQSFKSKVLMQANGTKTSTGGMIISANPTDVVSDAAMLELKSTSQGLLLPNAIPNNVSNPRGGLIIYNNSDKKVEVYNSIKNKWTSFEYTESSGTQAQDENTPIGVLVNDSETESTPHHSALLEIRATNSNKGFLLPSFTTQQIEDLKPEEGMIVFNNSMEKITYCDGNNWKYFLDDDCEQSETPISISSTMGNEICEGMDTRLSINGGKLGDAAEWHWYTGGCGVTHVGTGNSIDVFPDVTTTYYVRAEGECNVTSCVSYTITVNYVPQNVVVTLSGNNICKGGELTLSSSATNNIDSWEWYGPSNSLLSNDENPTVENLQPSDAGKYKLLASNQCGVANLVETQALVVVDIPTPTASTHKRCHAGIIWKWSSTPFIDGYKFNSVNDYDNAIDLDSETSYAQIDDFQPNTLYTAYLWGYNDCGESDVLELTFTTPNAFTCGDNFVDCRDEIEYKTMQFKVNGVTFDQCWMAENLKYLPEIHAINQPSKTEPRYYVNGYTVTNNPSVAAAKTNKDGGVVIYDIYGVLYNWPAAMGGEASSSAVPSGVRGACPHGWHLPSDPEIKELETFLGMPPGKAPNPPAPAPGMRHLDDQSFRGAQDTLEIGRKLKSTDYWAYPKPGGATLNNTEPSGYPVPQGTNTYGFNFRPGGGYNDDNQKFTETLSAGGLTVEQQSHAVGGGFITSTQNSSTNGVYRMFNSLTGGYKVTYKFLFITHTQDLNGKGWHAYGIGWYSHSKGLGASVRCVQDW